VAKRKIVDNIEMNRRGVVNHGLVVSVSTSEIRNEGTLFLGSLDVCRLLTIPA
jgi:hypothetical protein